MTCWLLSALRYDSCISHVPMLLNVRALLILSAMPVCRQRSLQVCDRRGKVLVDLPFPLEDFRLQQHSGSAAVHLAWDATGEQLAVLPRSQAAVLLWSRDEAKFTELDPGPKVELFLFARLLTTWVVLPFSAAHEWP